MEVSVGCNVIDRLGRATGVVVVHLLAIVESYRRHRTVKGSIRYGDLPLLRDELNGLQVSMLRRVCNCLWLGTATNLLQPPQRINVPESSNTAQA
jgi:hypothetical protein